MSLARNIAVGFLAVLLVTTAVSANVAIAADRTVLSGDYVTNTLSSEDAYASFRETAIETLSEESGTGGADVGGKLLTDALERAVTEEYVREQAEDNIDRFYGYLHGEEDSLALYVETEPALERLGPAIASIVEERTVGELIQATGVDPEFQDVPVDTELLTTLESGPEGYQEARTTFRERMTERVVDSLVEQTVADATDDELLALVIPDYDPRDYTAAEKERLVEDRRSEIEDALRDRILAERGDEIDRRVADRLDEYAAQVEAPADPQTVDEAAKSLEAVLVRGLADRDLTYETFHQDLAQAKRAAGEVLGATATEQAREQLGDEVSLTEQLDSDVKSQLERAKTVVGYIDLATILLPVLALVILGLMWLVSRSALVVSLAGGISLAIVGIGSAAGAQLVGSTVESALPAPNDVPAALADVLEALVNGVIDTFLTQSIVVLVLGAVLVVLAVLLWYDVLPWPDQGPNGEV